MKEGLHYDKKSLKKVVGKTADFDDLARHCVAFANARGGTIDIGIEDRETIPPAKQKIADELPHKIDLRISQLTINTMVHSAKKIANNGGEYIVLTIERNASTIAGTMDGRYFIRIGDQSKPVYPDQISRLFTDKTSFVWESMVTKEPRNSYDKDKAKQFCQDIKNSKKTSRFIKEKSLEELMTYYNFVDGDCLTNLGVLWLGHQHQRSKILYAPTIQFIKYDHREEKIKKIVWDDHRLNPKELLNAIINDIPEWEEGIEISDGLFRRVVPNYGTDAIRELLANAIFHKPYTIGGDIFINMYPDYVEIHNPGLLPVGVTPENILQKSVRRNETLCKLATSLELMEKEGSGIDKVYEELLSLGKQTPTIEEETDRVIVTVNRRITQPLIVRFIELMTEQYDLNRKERIALGLIAQHESISMLEFKDILALDGKNSSRSWVDRLVEFQIIVPTGKTKDRKYRVNLDFVQKAQLKIKTEHPTILPQLQELVVKDVELFPNSSISEIRERIGREVAIYKLRDTINKLIAEGTISKTGTKKATKYFIS